MAGVKPESREQLRAIALLRWRLIVNSLRSVRGRLNLVSSILGGLLVLGAGFIGGFVLFLVATWATSQDHRHLQWLTLPFWLIFLFWQLFPVMATAFTQILDSSMLLRFPMGYPTYFLVRVIYGTLDIANGLGLFWVAGLFLGISSADWRLAPWALLAVSLFAVFNILLGRMIFAWIEHWLSGRRSREILGFFFLLTMVSFQIFGSRMGHHAVNVNLQRWQAFAKLVPVAQALPPGLAAATLTNAAMGRSSAALLSFGLLVLFSGAAGWLLHLQLRRQYIGDNPAEGQKRRTQKEKIAVRRGWKLPLFSGPVSAVFEKELRYLSRSGPMLFTLIMPMVVVFVLWGGRRGFLGQQSVYALPLGAAYCLLVMTNLVYNSFGGDGGGIQFFFIAPISFRQIVIAKNAAHMAIVAVEVFLLWLGVRVVYSPPPATILALTVSWYLFAAPINFAAGDMLSIYSPKRIDYATFGRQRATATTVFVSLGVQVLVTSVGVLVVFVAAHYRNLWIASLILLALSIPSIAGYFFMLKRIDQIALGRREVLATELCRS